ncbi:MAG: hypothetical protein B6D59_02440 [Campylobacteraceae bacterium 4484_4]|nr:MAG: hypothetical protein B6D59_02440 [Campylobacteraceae bacterium 4484_4]
MGLIDILLDSGKGALVNEVAKETGADPDRAKDLLVTLGSAMLGQIKGRVESPKIDSSDLEELIRESRYAEMVEKPEIRLKDQRRREEGNEILSHITGSKEVSREVAAQVAKKTGFDTSIIKELLPMVAPLILGSIGKGLLGDMLKGTTSAGSSRAQNSGSSGLIGMLDFDNDGSVIDDVAKMAMRFLT